MSIQQSPAAAASGPRPSRANPLSDGTPHCTALAIEEPARRALGARRRLGAAGSAATSRSAGPVGRDSRRFSPTSKGACLPDRAGGGSRAARRLGARGACVRRRGAAHCRTARLRGGAAARGSRTRPASSARYVRRGGRCDLWAALAVRQIRR